MDRQSANQVTIGKAVEGTDSKHTNSGDLSNEHSDESRDTQVIVGRRVATRCCRELCKIQDLTLLAES